MKKILVFFFLLFFAGFALADPNTTDNLLSPSAVTNYTDMSIYYLTQIFGTVGKVLTGSSSQMMGQLFYKLNWGIFVVSGLLIAYAVVLGVIRMASEGVTMAPGKSTLFSLIKLALGVALIIPNGATGYSVLQTIVMKVVVSGVGLADSVWSNGLSYLNAGGAVWSAPESLDPNSKEGNYHYATALNYKNTDQLYKDASFMAPIIFKSAVCMVASRDLHKADSGYPYYNVQPDELGHRIIFPGINDESSTPNNPSCGYVSWNIKGACNLGTNNDISCTIARGAVSQLVLSLLPAAKNYYCETGGGLVKNGLCQGYSSPDKSYAAYLLDGAMDYFPAIQVYADQAKSQNSADSTKFIANAKKEGWLMAGRYYWDLMKLTNVNANKSDLSPYASSPDVIGPDDKAVKNQPEYFRKAVNGASNKIVTVYTTDYPDYRNSVYNESGSTQPSNKGQVGTSGNLISNGTFGGIVAGTYIVPGVAATFITAMSGINDIGNKFRDVTTYRYNPIQFLYELGQLCIKITLNIWIVGAVAISINLIAASICSASNPYFAGASAIVEWVKPIFMLIAIAFWTAGFFLSYYIPIYPYMLFLFAAVGWFISVIEAMVAAPLVALGLAHPEDHDLLGKAQQAVMLLLGVFIQPALLVIGLIAGIIFSYVTFELLIYTFSSFITDVLGSLSTTQATTNILAAVQNSQIYNGSSGVNTAILVQPLLLVVFCTILYTLLTQSFSLVYVLRDNVMRWIGAPPSGAANPEQLTADTKGAVSNFAKQTGDAVGSVATNYKAASEAPAALGGAIQAGSSAISGSDGNSVGGGGGKKQGGGGGVDPEMLEMAAL